jgi:hypothetical protein
MAIEEVLWRASEDKYETYGVEKATAIPDLNITSTKITSFTLHRRLCYWAGDESIR